MTADPAAPRPNAPRRMPRWLDLFGTSLGMRVVVLSALPVFAVVAVAGLIVMHEWRESARAAAREAAHAYLRTLSQPTARNLAVLALDRLDLDLSGAVGDERDPIRLREVSVHDHSGALVARSGSGGFVDPGGDLPVSASPGSTSHAAHEVAALAAFTRDAIAGETSRWRQRRGHDGTLLVDVAVPAVSGLRWGTLVGTFDITAVDRSARSTGFVIAGLALLVWLQLAAIVGLSLRQLMVEPIDELARAAAEIRRGQRGARAWVPSRDELGRLGDDFNAMADELEAYTQGLEAKVAERTAELERKHSELEQVHARLSQTSAELERLATVDALTGIRNRRSFDIAIEQEAQRAARNPHPFCVMMIDVDHFKHYNDCNGHQAGDRALAKVASVMATDLRATDVFARYGGEEFIVLLLDTDRVAGLRVADSLRRAVEASAFEHGAGQPAGRVTVSVGLASYPQDGVGPSDLVAHADAALYAAKRLGRNRVEAWQPPAAGGGAS